jgi:hypothetical protein
VSAASEAINASIVASVLTQRATVYTRAAGGGFTVEQQAGIPCRLDPVSRQPAATGAERRALAAMGSLRYDATYTIPDDTAVQLEVDAYPGKRWNVERATAWDDNVPGIGVVGKTVDVTRALS